MELRPLVNTDVKMPKSMMHALNMLETMCVCKQQDSVTEHEVHAFLNEHFGATLSAKFKPEYLFNTPSSLATHL